jgi:hypothetical protein
VKVGIVVPYSWSEIARRLVEIYEHVLRRGSAARVVVAR